jgi:serine/threonine protein kinase
MNLMALTPTRTEGSRHHAGLLLRVHHPDGHADEFYLATGLTIGRSLANAVVLDDDTVDRTHARVEVGDDGGARLRCVEPDGILTLGDQVGREVLLEPGVRFRIGRTKFECIEGRRSPQPPAHPSPLACPFCSSTAIATEGDAPRRCPGCDDLVLPVRFDPGSPTPLLLPVIYRDYHAQTYVARGGMGLVLKGTHAEDGRPVAIKVLLPGTIPDREEARRFEQEVAMLARVSHPNVVKLLDHGKSGRFHFLALEWIEGPSLRQVIVDAAREGKPTDFATAIRWFDQVTRGLAAIHSVGIIHRDLKPSNILIGPDGLARIADLGIARQVDGSRTSYTMTGHAPGTYDYMAPEQRTTPDLVDARADFYSLGMTFYECLTGTRPIGLWQPASVINSTVPKEFDAILERLLAPKAEARHSDIFDMILGLAMFRGVISVTRNLEPVSTSHEIREQVSESPKPVIENASQQLPGQVHQKSVPRVDDKKDCPSSILAAIRSRQWDFSVTVRPGMMRFLGVIPEV